MPDKKSRISSRRETLVEKIMRRSLETVGGSVDSIFGRGKKPDALPATSDLAERLRKIIDRQAQINKDGRKLAPHLISLKYAWGQTSDEFQVALKRLKNELLVVAIDFINDNRFTTLAPVKIEAKADILTVGFTMSIGFDEASLRDAEQVEIPVEIYAKLLPNFQADAPPAPRSIVVNVAATLPNGKTRNAVLQFIPEKKTTLTVGRIKETDLYLDDDSVSKHHASLVMNETGVLLVADIGSTNGTFLHGARIAYGKAFEIERQATVGFGDVTAIFDWEIPASDLEPETLEPETLSGLSEDVNRENIETLETDKSGIKIGVKSAVINSDEQSFDANEDSTVLGVLREKKTDEPPNEPETVNKQVENELETLNKPILNSFTETLNSESPSSAATIESSSEQLQETGQLRETGQLTDFTRSLETNPLDKSLLKKQSTDFDSLHEQPSEPDKSISPPLPLREEL